MPRPEGGAVRRLLSKIQAASAISARRDGEYFMIKAINTEETFFFLCDDDSHGAAMKRHIQQWQKSTPPADGGAEEV